MNQHEIVREITNAITKSISRLDTRPVHHVAAFIVDDTWGHKASIMDFIIEYPELITVADLASDIELLDEDDDYRRELWSKLLLSFEELKDKVAKNENRA